MSIFLSNQLNQIYYKQVSCFVSLKHHKVSTMPKKNEWNFHYPTHCKLLIIRYLIPAQFNLVHINGFINFHYLLFC